MEYKIRRLRLRYVAHLIGANIAARVRILYKSLKIKEENVRTFSSFILSQLYYLITVLPFI